MKQWVVVRISRFFPKMIGFKLVMGLPCMCLISLLLYVIGYELFRTNSNSFFRTSVREVGAASRYDMIPIPKKF